MESKVESSASCLPSCLCEPLCTPAGAEIGTPGSQPWRPHEGPSEILTQSWKGHELGWGAPGLTLTPPQSTCVDWDALQDQKGHLLLLKPGQL